SRVRGPGPDPGARRKRGGSAGYGTESAGREPESAGCEIRGHARNRAAARRRARGQLDTPTIPAYLKRLGCRKDYRECYDRDPDRRRRSHRVGAEAVPAQDAAFGALQGHEEEALLREAQRGEKAEGGGRPSSYCTRQASRPVVPGRAAIVARSDSLPLTDEQRAAALQARTRRRI